MRQDDRFWRDYGFPALLSAVAFAGLNGIWNHPVLSLYVGPWFPSTVAVYLLGGSGLAVLLLWRAARGGQLAPSDLGLDLSGWSAPRRLLGLAVILFVAYGGFATISPAPSPSATEQAKVGVQPPAAPPPQEPALGEPSTSVRPTWGEYCFWFVTLLSASLAELLVFLGMGFCLIERGLRTRGLSPLLAAAVAAPVACVSFGLYHYTYEPRWHPYVGPLMLEMALVLGFFLATRNFYLTLALHNALATLGFTTEQFSADPLDPSYFSEPKALTANVLSFIVPFLLLHGLEWKGWGRASGQVKG